jgi:hypothetical protein
MNKKVIFIILFIAMFSMIYIAVEKDLKTQEICVDSNFKLPNTESCVCFRQDVTCVLIFKNGFSEYKPIEEIQ